jgi:endonuclease YncB( thermonuclease family)
MALSALLGFTLVGVEDAFAARSVASGQQVKKKIRPATQVAAKKRTSVTAKAPLRTVASVAAAPVFRPPKAPAQRHYAVDGSTFYADGVRIKAAGLEALEMSTASSIGKHKLQQLLDSGRVSIEPLDFDDGDVTLARVRIDGRDLSELVGMR